MYVQKRSGRNVRLDTRGCCSLHKSEGKPISNHVERSEIIDDKHYHLNIEKKGSSWSGVNVQRFIWFLPLARLYSSRNDYNPTSSTREYVSTICFVIIT